MTGEERLWRQARRAALLLQLVPFVRFVAVTGSLGRGEAGPDSDADLFVVTAPGRLYTARALALVLLHATQQRINVEAGRIAGSVDPNYWLSADDLDIRPHTAFVARDYTAMVPLWDGATIYDRLRYANEWVGRYRRRFRDAAVPRPLPALRVLQWLFEAVCRLWPGLEAWTRAIQERRVRSFAARQGKADNVVLTDTELRLHR
jgi:predicted nucleotidyltransferase